MSMPYNIHRWYEVGVGRYTRVDPKGVVHGDRNPYVYALGNPISYADPLGLDTVGCDVVSDKLETPCVLQCCAIHDACYDAFNCTARSWRDPANDCDRSLEFTVCNLAVTACVASCSAGAKQFNPRLPSFYCASQHRFVRIPGDFRNRKEAEDACDYDHSKDCCSVRGPPP